MTASSWGPARTAWTAESSSGPEWNVDVAGGQPKKDSVRSVAFDSDHFVVVPDIFAAQDSQSNHAFSLRHRSAHSAHAATLNGARLVGLGDDDQRGTAVSGQQDPVAPYQTHR